MDDDDTVVMSLRKGGVEDALWFCQNFLFIFYSSAAKVSG